MSCSPSASCRCQISSIASRPSSRRSTRFRLHYPRSRAMPRSTPSSSKSGRTMLDKVEVIVSPVYQVGGSVRDELLGKTPMDYDFATPLSPDEVEAAIKAAGKHAYAIGKR